MTKSAAFNPLGRLNLGKSVADALLESVALPLGELAKFSGEGIYALYYSGQFRAYKQISSRNAGGQFRVPIYVGKAVPPGARKGGILTDEKTSTALFRRLREHARSIDDAKNLKIEDFWCRFLVVEDIWIPLGESLLIARFAPIWNNIIDGYGNHTPGSGRYNQKISRWDVIHPGREWANKCQPRSESAREILADVTERLRHVSE